MRYLLLIIGTALAVLFMIQLSRGKEFNYMVENLDNDTYPLYALYVVGFAWSSGKLFAFTGKKAAKLKEQAAMLYDMQYAEYYANLAWAQALSLTHLFLTLTFLLSAIMYSMVGLILMAGIFMSVFMAVYSLENMKNNLSERTAKCEQMLAEVVSTMAILVNSGMMLREVWIRVSESGDSEIHQLMKKATINMNNGYSDADAIYLFGRSSNSTDIKKFTSALLQSMDKGGSDLSAFLTQQSSELWSTKKQKMLQAGEQAASKLLMPIMLIFVGVIIIVISAALGGSLF